MAFSLELVALLADRATAERLAQAMLVGCE
jgi:hypothetical protein